MGELRAGKNTFLSGWLGRALRPLAILILRAFGWRAVGGLPEAKTVVVTAAPHTSNWDGILLILLGLELRADLRWLGKRQLFPRPFGGLMKWFGGIPVNRSRNTKLTEQVASVLQNSEQLLLIITPEGTRSRVERWKTGFYRIAQIAQVPIAMGFVDFGTKTGGIGPAFLPAPVEAELDSPEVLRDIETLRAFYKDKVGKYPDQFGPVRF